VKAKPARGGGGLLSAALGAAGLLACVQQPGSDPPGSWRLDEAEQPAAVLGNQAGWRRSLCQFGQRADGAVSSGGSRSSYERLCKSAELAEAHNNLGTREKIRARKRPKCTTGAPWKSDPTIGRSLQFGNRAGRPRDTTKPCRVTNGFEHPPDCTGPLRTCIDSTCACGATWKTI